MTELDSAPTELSTHTHGGPFRLPASPETWVETPLVRTSAPDVPKRIWTTPFLAITVASGAAAFGLAGLQITRVMYGKDRIGLVSWLELATAIVAAVGVVVWTWLAVENARRLLAAGMTADAPSPTGIALAWTMPLVVVAAAVGATTYLERRLNSPELDETSVVPLGVAFVALVVAMLVSYRPLFMLSAVMRRLGARNGVLSRWMWVPLTLAVAGVLTLYGLRAGGAFGDDFDGFAPAWALGVIVIPPVVVLLALAWRGGRMVEESIDFAFARRSGTAGAGVGRGRLGLFGRLLRADARPAIARDTLEPIRLVPGLDIFRLAMMTAVAALTLVSVVGALVMFLFWREAADGALLPTQRERAWTALDGLQSLERLLGVGLVALASFWSFLTVLNARLASGRRRNPVLAAASWPVAAWGIWMIGVRFEDASGIGPVVTGFALQSVVAFVPFFLLERAAVSVGARRGPLRLTYGLCVVLLVHTQGLGGLSTVVEVSDIDRFGRIAGYLVLAAVLELIVTIAITDASTLISDAATTMADKHNFLADQRNTTGARLAPLPQTMAPLADVAERRQLHFPGPIGAPTSFAATAAPTPLPPPPPSGGGAIPPPPF